MGSASSPTFSLFKLDLAVSYSPRLTQNLSSSIPFGRNHFRKLVLVSQRTSKLSLSQLNWSTVNSLMSNFSFDDTIEENCPQVEVKTCMWNWRGHSIRYQYSGYSGPAIILVHGFGANSDHWRKNIPVLARSHRVFSIDLIGYGYSDKPNPRKLGVKFFYTFETWASQLNDFCTNVVKDEAFFICNSIGGLVGLQAAIMEPQICKGIILLNISLRMLHIKKQPWYGRPLIRSFQSLLRNTVLGNFFFRAVATPETVKSILCQVSSVMTWLSASLKLMLEMARATRKINEKEKTVKLEFLLVMNIDLCWNIISKFPNIVGGLQVYLKFP